MKMTPFRIETAFWLLLSGGLTTGIGMETDWGQRWQREAPEVRLTPAEFSAPVLNEPFRLPPADELLETAMRPVFVVTRRPAPPTPPPEAPKPTMKKDQFTLSGITVVPGGKFAFIIERAGNRSRVVSEGKEINGVVVKEILPDRVVLSQYDDTEVLMLKTAKGPTPNPVTSAASAPPPLVEPAAPPGGARPGGRPLPATSANNGQASQ
jgi:hypothetical protein